MQNLSPLIAPIMGKLQLHLEQLTDTTLLQVDRIDLQFGKCVLFGPFLYLLFGDLFALFTELDDELLCLLIGWFLGKVLLRLL